MHIDLIPSATCKRNRLFPTVEWLESRVTLSTIAHHRPTTNATVPTDSPVASTDPPPARMSFSESALHDPSPDQVSENHPISTGQGDQFHKYHCAILDPALTGMVIPMDWVTLILLAHHRPTTKATFPTDSPVASTDSPPMRAVSLESALPGRSPDHVPNRDPFLTGQDNKLTVNNYVIQDTTMMGMVVPMDLHDPGHVDLLQMPQASSAPTSGTTTHDGADMSRNAAMSSRSGGTMAMDHPTASIPRTGGSRGARADETQTNPNLETMDTAHGDATPQEFDPKLKLDPELEPKSGLELSPPLVSREDPRSDPQFEAEGRKRSASSPLDKDSREDEVESIAISESNNSFAMILAGLTSLRGLHPMSGRPQHDETSGPMAEFLKLLRRKVRAIGRCLSRMRGVLFGH